MRNNAKVSFFTCFWSPGTYVGLNSYLPSFMCAQTMRDDSWHIFISRINNAWGFASNANYIIGYYSRCQGSRPLFFSLPGQKIYLLKLTSFCHLLWWIEDKYWSFVCVNLLRRTCWLVVSALDGHFWTFFGQNWPLKEARGCGRKSGILKKKTIYPRTNLSLVRKRDSKHNVKFHFFLKLKVIVTARVWSKC